MGVGSEITSERVNELYEEDIEGVLNDCRWLFDGWETLPEEIRLVLANMMFNLGLPKLSRFVEMRACIDRGEWQGMADEMENSLWRKQVPNRSARLINRVRSVG